MSEAVMDEWDFEAHWLYRIYDGFGRALYIGETNNLPRRLAEHMEKAWFRRPDITIKMTAFPNRAEALAAESRAIETELPWYNKAGMPKPKSVAPKEAVTAKPERPARRARRAKPAAQRSLVADLDRLLGHDRVRLSVLPHLLRQLAPEWEPYQDLNGARLREMLLACGVRTINPKNVPMLDPADLKRPSGYRAASEVS